MLKGLHFMAWYRDMWNYHPSLPMKNMQMIEDIVDMRANILIWSCLGSGAIGLPYLDKEANSVVDPRMRFYGFLNDKEFCAECAKRGVTAFAVLWKAQLWEFAAEFNDDETELLAFNILRDTSENKKYLGMSELSTNKYPALFDPIEKYFPEGLLDYKGNKVVDFLEEFKTLTLEGKDIFSLWLMVPEHDQKCYTPCCWKESYHTYLKRNVEMMIDAGCGGLFMDEYDVQYFVTKNAGCFCRECVDKFNEYLKEKKITLPADVESPDTFNYKEYLLAKGYRDSDLNAQNGTARWEIPLFRHYIDMQLASIAYVIAEISSHAKTYARKTQGRDLPVTSNLYQCNPVSWDCKKHLDILSGERTFIELRQDGWYKFAFGWLNGKESCFAEDPNEYVRSLVEDIRNGINDRFILLMMEPLAHGFHIAFPYGSWLQNQEKDALWPDLRLLRKMGKWLDDNENLFPKKPIADIAVVYNLHSAYESYYFMGEIYESFFGFIQELSKRHVLYNVLYESPDEPLDAGRLEGYSKVIVPDAYMMGEDAVAALNDFAKGGGELITYARKPESLNAHKSFEKDERLKLVDYLKSSDKGIVEADGNELYGIGVHESRNGCVVHFVNYNFNEDTHKIDNIPEIKLKINFDAEKMRLHSFPENHDAEAELKGSEVTLRNAGIYTVLEFITER